MQQHSHTDLTVSEDQALAFRSRRHHLLGPGAGDPTDAARAVLGIQAQVVAPALWSLAMRTAARPSAEDLADRLATSPALVRTWGQRGTVHIYDAATHWPAIVTALQEWTIGDRGGPHMDASQVDAAEKRIRALERPVTRSDLFELLPEEFVSHIAKLTGPGDPALRGAAGRLIRYLAWRGELSAHTVVDGEQSYVLRDQRYPDLAWAPPSEPVAGDALARAYLHANAPASAKDLSHFLGIRVTAARKLLAHLGDELITVSCNHRSELVALRSDAADLAAELPDDWPPRLLPKFDTYLMGHADKSWTVPLEADRPKIWAKAAHVNATVLHRGRLVATWKHTAQKRSVRIDITPLSGWQSGLEDQLANEAQAFANHLGRDQATVRVC